jgi:hypothetical protein
MKPASSNCSGLMGETTGHSEISFRQADRVLYDIEDMYGADSSTHWFGSVIVLAFSHAKSGKQASKMNLAYNGNWVSCRVIMNHAYHIPAALASRLCCLPLNTTPELD